MCHIFECRRFYETGSCSGDPAIQTWNNEDYCHRNSSSSYKLSCSSTQIGDHSLSVTGFRLEFIQKTGLFICCVVTTYVKMTFDSSDCSGPSVVTRSNVYDVCDTLTLSSGSTDINIPFIQSCYGYPRSSYCVNESSLVYSSQGGVSIMGTLEQCMKNMGGDIVFFPGYLTGESVNVSVSVSLNNIIGVSEVRNTISLDLYLYFSWTDYRLAMPALFNAIGYQGNFGLDITPAINVQNIFGATTNVWLPEVMFPGIYKIHFFLFSKLPGD